MEIRYGILQIAEALFYLHTTERLLHLNVCPQNVIVTKRGTWKLTGLCFTQSIGTDAQSNVSMHPHRTAKIWEILDLVLSMCAT